MFRSAFTWEYRWRIALLFLSQPVLALTHYWLSGSTGIWYAPEFKPVYGAVAALLGLTGAAIRVWGTSYLSAEVVTGLTARNDRLITGGPYAIVRNPLYVGTLLIFAGFGMFFGPLYAAAFVLAHWLRYGRVIRYEEGFLRSEWGRQFDDYCASVPRWLPNALRRSDLVGPFVSIDGLLGNGVFLGMAVGYAAAAWLGNLDVLVYSQTLGFIISALAKFQPRRSVARPKTGMTKIPATVGLSAQKGGAGQTRRAG